MFMFWVIGGIDEDTESQELASGDEDWVGPFATYDEAKAEWSKRSWGSVDDAQCRYRIESLDPDDVPPCTD
jgi:hypothetical protein